MVMVKDLFNVCEIYKLRVEKVHAFCPFLVASLSAHPKTRQKWLTVCCGSSEIYRVYVLN